MITFEDKQDPINQQNLANMIAEIINSPEDMQHDLIMMLQYASDKLIQLTQEDLNKFIEKYPGTILQYYFDNLTPEQIDACADKAPLIALKYASNKLTSEKLDWCKQKFTLTQSTFSFGGLGWGVKQLGDIVSRS